ncbi:MAG: phage tail sheath subtilisin-like domain-containing protein [Bacillota bacterium]
MPFFDGRFILQPQAASKIDDSALINVNGGGGLVGAVIGSSKGGKPGDVLWFSSAEQAKTVLRDGNGLKAIQRMFAPSASVPGASKIGFVRVEPATQSTLTLKDGASVDVIDLKSTDYGIDTNRVKIKIEAGTTKGKKITTAFDGTTAISDNIAKDAFKVQYTGAGATCTVSITATQVAITSANPAESVTLQFATYPTLKAVVDAILAKGVYTASTNYPDDAGTVLDFVTTQDIKTAEYTATANLQAVVDWLNGSDEPYIEATRKASVGTVPANIGYTYLTNGVDGSVTNTEWQNAFDLLKTVDVQVICPATGDASIHAMGDTHCVYMSGVGKKPRRQVVGGIAGETVAQAKTRAQNLAGDRTVLVFPGVKDYNASGSIETLDPFFTASQVAGMFCGVSVGTSLTHKYIRAKGLEKILTPAEIDDLLVAGVLPIEYVSGKGYRIVQSITTWQKDKKYNRREASVGFAVDSVDRAVRDNIDEYLVGGTGGPTLLAQTISITETVLKTKEREGIIVGDKDNPAFRNIQARLEGEIVYLSYEASFGVPANYFLITAHMQPYSGSAS